MEAKRLAFAPAPPRLLSATCPRSVPPMSTKVAVWNGMTDTHGFMVDVFEDREQGQFRAIVRASKPPIAPMHVPGQPVAMMTFEDEERILAFDLDALRALTRKLISDLYGKIRRFDERNV